MHTIGRNSAFWRVYTSLPIVILLALVLTPAILQAAHPFLIVTEANYPELQARASGSPWSDIKANALNDASNLVYDPGLYPYKIKTSRLRDVVSSCSLAYILDPTNRTQYKNKIRDQLNTGLDNLAATRSSAGTWEANTALECALFAATLAMDIVYNDLTPGERTTIETKIEDLIRITRGSTPSYEGTTAVWALYKGDMATFDAFRIYYRDAIYNFLTSSGVFMEGSGYANARFGFEDRMQKSLVMDIFEYQGYHDFYSNVLVQNFHEWMYGYTTTAFRRNTTFGDSSPGSTIQWDRSPQIWRAYRFGEKAGDYASRYTSGNIPSGRLLTYILMEQAPPSPKVAPSRIFPDGGAFFNENSLSSRALSIGLWNPMSIIGGGGHAHKDISAIHMGAYGEHVIRNSGYAGWLSGDWTWIHDRAYSNSTAFISNVDHATKYGNGIIEGLTAPDLGLDYACSDSGPAISNGLHYRNLLFIHPKDGVNGYSVLFDEFDADSDVQWSSTRLHPNADNMTTVLRDTEYQSQINQLTFSGHTVYISMFLGTAPTEIAIATGQLAHLTNNWFGGKYLFPEYESDDDGMVNVVTVLFPHDSTHAKAAMTRISGTGYTGASIAQGGITDIALESAGTSTITHSGVSFNGLATWYRNDSGLVTSYFVRKGQSFDDGISPKVGFSSVSDVSIYIGNREGRIISEGTNVTFYYPGILGVLLNGSGVPNISSGTDWVEVNIPSGTHKVQFTTVADTTPPEPNPMTWSVQPYATGSKSIAMKATTASDLSGVEYYFECTSGGGNDSGWQSSNPVYEDTGLNPGAEYSYCVKTRDKSANQNETGFSAVVSATTEGGLVAHWKLDETTGNIAYDAAGTGNGTLMGDPTWTTGQIDGALDFDGIDDCVDVSDDTLLRFSQSDSFSITCWVKPNSEEPTMHGYLVSKMRASAQSGVFGYQLYWASSQSKFIFNVEASRRGKVEANTSITSADVWHQVTAVYDNKDMKIYLDGQLEGTQTFTYNTGTTTPDKNLSIGARSYDSVLEYYFNGKIDDVRIYNKALSGEEIEELHQEALPIYVDDDATGDNDGTSWKDAFNYIQNGIDAASDGKTVLVGEGQYVENINFNGKYITVTSTNPKDAGIVANTIIDGSSVNSSTVIFENVGNPASSSVSAFKAVLSGFTITGGYGTVNPQFSSSLYWGGGIYCYLSSPTIMDNVIVGNDIPMGNSGPVGYGAGISCLESNATITNNIFRGNSAFAGGGIMTWSSNDLIINNLIYDNLAHYGGGVCLLGNSQLINNTLVDNEAINGGANIYGSGRPVVTNNIICSGKAGGGIYWDGGYQNTITFNDVWGNTGGNYTGLSNQTGINGNISADPRLVETQEPVRDYHLLDDSPCVNAGANSAIPASVKTDFDGKSRIIDGCIDMGAYETITNTAPVANAGPNQIAYAW
ncbi:MAG: hypothetical protein KAS75_00340, partial [Planctomycetes bacterium]|nr:hypothetical protein [Planctomycetota bacterium]